MGSPIELADNTIMCPTNVAIVCVVDVATIAIIQILIMGNSFTLKLGDSLCIVISVLPSTACIRLFTRQNCIPRIQFRVVVMIRR